MSSHLPIPTPHHHHSPLLTLAPHLLPHLPHSLPLLRRLQYTPPSSTAVVLATFPDSPSIPPSPPFPNHFAALHVDRARAPETECWIFSTEECGRKSKSGQFDHQGQRASRNVFALLDEVARLGREDKSSRFLVVGTLNEDLLGLVGGEEVWGLKAEKVLRRDGYSDRAGSWLERERKGGGGGEGVVAGVSVVYKKWIITPPSAPGSPASRSGPEEINGEVCAANGGGMIEGVGISTQKWIMAPSTTSNQKSVPEGYCFSKVRREELQIVISRTDIPKTEETLARLGGVALRYRTPSTEKARRMTARGEEEGEADGGDLIAWAFLGVDCSLSSLHVEPEHRGKGLAKAVTWKLFEELARDPLSVGFRPLEGDTVEAGVEDGAGWAHADVSIDNLESAGVVRGLGGKEGWRVRWVSVDLERVEMVVGEMRRKESLGLSF